MVMRLGEAALLAELLKFPGPVWTQPILNFSNVDELRSQNDSVSLVLSFVRSGVSTLLLAPTSSFHQKSNED